jgi:hypothetical protein
MSHDQVARVLRREILQEMPRIREMLEATFRRQEYRQKKRHVLKLISRSQLEITLYICNAFKRHFILGAWYRDARGYCYAHLESGWVTIYQTHLFERFSERYLHRKKEDVKCVGRQFFFGRPGMECEYLDEETPLTEIPITKHTPGGLVFGTKNLRQELSVMRTYVDFPTMNRKKIIRLREYETREPLLHHFRALFPDALTSLYPRPHG